MNNNQLAQDAQEVLDMMHDKIRQGSAPLILPTGVQSGIAIQMEAEQNFVNMGYSGPPTAVYKAGDKVRSKASNIKGTVRSHDPIAGVCNVAWDDEWFGTESLSENAIELLEPEVTMWKPTCECGSKFVPGFEGLHSKWCSAFKE